jgi:hypothetical protein
LKRFRAVIAKDLAIKLLERKFNAHSATALVILKMLKRMRCYVSDVRGGV